MPGASAKSRTHRPPPNAPTRERARHDAIRVVLTNTAGICAHAVDLPDALARLLAAGALTEGEHAAVVRLKGLAATAGLAERLSASYEPRGDRGHQFEADGETEADRAEETFRRGLRAAGRVGADELAALAVYDEMPRDATALARLRVAVRTLAAESWP